MVSKKYQSAFGRDCSVTRSRSGDVLIVETAGSTFVPQLRYAHSVDLPLGDNGLPIKVLAYQPAPFVDEVFRVNFAGTGKREALLGEYVDYDGKEESNVFLVKTAKEEIMTATHALVRVAWSSRKPGFKGIWQHVPEAEFFSRVSKLTTKSGYDFWVLRLPQVPEAALETFREEYADRVLQEQRKVS